MSAVPDFDGLPPLPDFTDLDAIEGKLIPALEAWVTDSDRGTAEWALRFMLLVVVGNRLTGARRLTMVENELEGLRELIGARFASLEQVVLTATDDGVARVLDGAR